MLYGVGCYKNEKGDLNKKAIIYKDLQWFTEVYISLQINVKLIYIRKVEWGLECNHLIDV